MPPSYTQLRLGTRYLEKRTQCLWAPTIRARSQTSLRPVHVLQIRTAKSVSKRKVKDLGQGSLGGPPLPSLTAADKEELRKTSMLQEVRNNMNKFSNCVVITRVGNFYELYFEHAETYAPLLGLKCAVKGKDKAAMAGWQLPYLERYLKILVQDLNKHVAICEEFPEYIDGELQQPITRRVTRVVTPGTLIDESFVDGYQNNYLLSIHYTSPEDQTQLNGKPQKKEEQEVGLAWIDVSTGDFYVQTTTRAALPSTLLRIGASEILVSDDILAKEREDLALYLGLTPERIVSTKLDSDHDDTDGWQDRLEAPMTPEEAAALTSAERVASNQILHYLEAHLLNLELRLRKPQRHESEHFMVIDRSSVRGLELLKTSRDGLGKGSLLHAVRRTVTKGGTRLLRERLTYPSVNMNEINRRLDIVSMFLASGKVHQRVIVRLCALHDIQRLLQKLVTNRADAEDLLCLANSILQSEEILLSLRQHSAHNAGSKAVSALTAGVDLNASHRTALRVQQCVDRQGIDYRPPMDLHSGSEPGAESLDGYNSPEADLYSRSTAIEPEESADQETWTMRRDATPALTELHGQLTTLLELKHDLEVKLQEQLQSPKLALKFDARNGHYCYAPRAKKFTDEILKGMGGRPIGTTKFTRTFVIPEWTDLGRRSERIKFDIKEEEQRLFQELRREVVQSLIEVRKLAGTMDEIDLLASFATLAAEQNWTRPVLSTKSIHNIIGGRHPTVKLGLEEAGRSFVSNDLLLDASEQTWLITGPNMAGKSTFLRQNAVITILAQMGSYVPADFAEIGLVDKMFSRIGAADDLFRNQSTFMVEMLETASILRDATEQSFVIMDEVGRGTTPEDGTAIAFAALQYLHHTNRCRTLFATHFHLLADATAGWPKMGQYCTDLYEDGRGGFSFVHKLRAGVNRRSHALKVAGLAGMPTEALKTAQEFLTDGIPHVETGLLASSG